VTDYLARAFEPADTAAIARFFTLYVGYYDRQSRGRTIHSPKNCLPGAGWEPLANSVAHIAMPGGAVPINRYLLQKGNDRALVLYWYQGRGRVAANEYRVKWELIRDAALRGRTDEALVRIVVPLRASEAEAEVVAESMARELISLVGQVVPS
jgi:EpsI family protein